MTPLTPSSSSLPLISVTTHSSQSDVGQEDAATSQELRLLSQLSHYPGPNCPKLHHMVHQLIPNPE